ncbi:hypothetical protein EZ313_13510 [Ramlibacter henchirensis]|uniref:Uncharacterized protein n=1 Tax=Ramlibacter henchirensis TaxID=204072 RepID=A0A4Z0BW67_9BURK|nr:hypothetical protein [Ramlibacter henchirensis]TFZ02285.1 hypothetical protein EZ313_13510 [Ramlibacter henchirensis]
MPRSIWSPCRPLCAALAAVLSGMAQAETPPPPESASGSLETPDVQLRYELVPPREGQQGRLLLQGEVEAGPTRLRTQVRIAPGTLDQPVGGVDASWDMPAPGPLGRMVVGDGYTGGAGWSPPARITGLRFGRAVTLREPLRADPVPVAAPAFLGLHPSVGWEERWRAEARRLMPTGGGPSAPTPGDPQPLRAGATDYEVQIGRLREGWDTTDRRYGQGFGAAAYRAGLFEGLTAEARAEWTSTQSAQGFELLQQLGGGTALQALTAQSTAPEGSGQRWGIGLVSPGERLRWRLSYAAADREFRSPTGGAEAREGVRLDTRVQLTRRASAEASLARRMAWDAVAPESTLALGSELDLTRQVRMRMDLSRRVGVDPAWRAGVSMSLPLE